MFWKECQFLFSFGPRAPNGIYATNCTLRSDSKINLFFRSAFIGNICFNKWKDLFINFYLLSLRIKKPLAWRAHVIYLLMFLVLGECTTFFFLIKFISEIGRGESFNTFKGHYGNQWSCFKDGVRWWYVLTLLQLQCERRNSALSGRTQRSSLWCLTKQRRDRKAC